MDQTVAEARPLSLLIVDDDNGFRQALMHRFLQRGFQVQDAADAEQAMSLVQRHDFDVAIFDVILPGMSGLALLDWFIKGPTDCEVIMLTGQGTIESAVEAMKLGAYDYVTKPVPLKDLETLVGKAYERRRLKKENEQLKLLLRRSVPDQVMIGQSPSMQEIYRLIERAGPSDKAILIQGESGTGKELVARALHHRSRRVDRPLVVINCAALPESLLESELFGHEKGAFTGAVSTKPGLFEVADGGTLFIDEIGEMPAALQAKLLRVLEDGSLRRVGSIKERRVNVRLLTATNCDLARLVAAGSFREDLYYRINVMSLELPPLRDRAGDIPLLVRHFLGSGWEVEPRALQVLEEYDWPGNVRQLINAVERARIMAEGRVLRICDFPRETTEYHPPSSWETLQRHDDLATIERAKIVEVLRRERGNKTRAAKSLGIDRRKLYRLVEKHRIEAAELERATA